MAGRSDVEAILVRYPRGALTPVQAILILTSEHDGAPLDPERADGAATLLRAERLIAAGQPVRAALAHARAELLASRPRRRAEAYFQISSFSLPTRAIARAQTSTPRRPPTSGRQPELVFCEICRSQKAFVVEAGLCYPRCGHRPITLAQPAAATQPTARPRRSA